MKDKYVGNEVDIAWVYWKDMVYMVDRQNNLPVVHMVYIYKVQAEKLVFRWYGYGRKTWCSIARWCGCGFECGTSYVQQS